MTREPSARNVTRARTNDAAAIAVILSRRAAISARQTTIFPLPWDAVRTTAVTRVQTVATTDMKNEEVSNDKVAIVARARFLETCETDDSKTWRSRKG